MKILRLKIANFRGIRSLTVLPRGHVALVGEPRAGRTSVIEALERVLTSGPSRRQMTNDLDFYKKDKSLEIEIEVVLGSLGDDLTQDFFDQQEFWDPGNQQLVDGALGQGAAESVLRLAYRAVWSEANQIGEHFVHFPKQADPANDRWERVRAAQFELIPVVSVRSSGAPFGIAARAAFRELVDAANGDDFGQGLDAFAVRAEELGGELAQTGQVAAALGRTLAPLESTIDVSADDEPLGFTLEEGGIGGVLRALTPTLDADEAGSLPIRQHGSTMTSSLVVGELLAQIENSPAVILIDDFGEQLDDAGARHLTALLRANSSQAWITTRRVPVADAFRADEVVRLTRSTDLNPQVFYGEAPTNKNERLAAKHLSLQLLPAMAAKAIVIVEGPHDQSGLKAMSDRILDETQAPLLAAHRIALVHAGAADGAGGATAIPRLAQAAKTLGFYVVALIDGDPGNDAERDAALAAADSVIRLPDRIAIERALLDDVGDAAIRDALSTLGVTLPADFETLKSADLRRFAASAIKGSGGHHAQFVDALEFADLPRLPQRIITEVIECLKGRKTEVVQL